MADSVKVRTAVGACLIAAFVGLLALDHASGRGWGAVALSAALMAAGMREYCVMTRLTGRRVCPACKAVFHVTSRPPAAEGVCDQCGGQLEQRADDRPEAVQVRLAAYAADTTPLAAHYRAMNLLIPISAAGRPEDIFARTLDALAGLVLRP